MKIFRIDDLKSTERPWGQLGNFGEQAIPEKAKTVGFWYPRIPPNGKLKAHAHKEQLEFMYFLNPAKVKCGKETYTMSPGDVLMAEPGDFHELAAGPAGLTLFVVKMPNLPGDTVYE